MYSEIVAAYDELAQPMRKLSDLYEASRAILDNAVFVDLQSGQTQVDRDALRTGFEQISPPIDPQQLEQVAADLELGFLVRDGMIYGPASMLLNPNLTQQLDIHAWRTLGIEPDVRPNTVSRSIAELFGDVPDTVLAPENLQRLVREVTDEQKRVARFERYSRLAPNALQQRNGGPSDPPVKGGATPHQNHPAGGSVTTTVPWQSVVDAADCLVNAQWTMWWYGPQVCMDRRCADALQAVLVGTDVQSFMTAFMQLAIKVFENVAAGSVAGWVSAGISSGMLHWGLMIAANKTPRGVCLIIPGPWTLGLMGPGWAVGRR